LFVEQSIFEMEGFFPSKCCRPSRKEKRGRERQGSENFLDGAGGQEI
jgi:hypothetical protein